MIRLSHQELNRRFTWCKYGRLLEQLAFAVKKADWKLQFVSGIPRGGDIVAVAMSHALKLEYVTFGALGAGSIPFGSSVLLCDDLVESGETYRQLAERFRDNWGVKPHLAALIGKGRGYERLLKGEQVVTALKRPNMKDWIVFPYESRGAENRKDGTI